MGYYKCLTHEEYEKLEDRAANLQTRLDRLYEAMENSRNCLPHDFAIYWQALGVAYHEERVEREKQGDSP